MPLIVKKPPNGASLLTLTNNAASATHAFNDGSHCMAMIGTDTGAASTERVRFRGKAVPAGSNWDVTAGIWTPPFGRAGGYLKAGLAVLQNSSGKSLAVDYNTLNNAPIIETSYMSALGTYGSNPGITAPVVGGRFPIMFRITYDGTNYIFKYSLDFGDTWDTLSTLAKASYFTADRVGLWLETYGVVVARQCRLDCYHFDDPDFP